MNILICDDDIPTVDMLKNQINWDSFGISEVFTAYNGAAAIAVIDEKKPDMVICDIEMPKGDGIEVLRHIRDSKADTEFCFLTCFDSFDYARTAVKLGASNYLMKPVELNEIEEAVNEMKQRFLEKKSDREQLIRGKNDETERLLGHLLTGKGPENREALQQQLSEYRIALDIDRKWCPVLIIAETAAADKAEWNSDRLQRFIYGTAGVCIAGKEGYGLIGSDSGDHFSTYLILIESGRFTDFIIRNHCHEFIGRCREMLSVEPVCLIGEEISLSEGITLLPQMYGKLKKLRMNSGKVYDKENSGQTPAEKRDGAADFLNTDRLYAYFRNRDRAGYIGYVNECIMKFSAGGSISDSDMVLFWHKLQQSFYFWLRDNQIPLEDFMNDADLQVLDKQASRSLIDMIKYAAYAFDRLITVIGGNISAQDSVDKVIAYIKAHYRENIGRELISDEIGLSMNYLSKVFNERTGQNIRDYITGCRIDEAKRLLLTTNKPVSDIALEVGFDNFSYFSTVFRKWTGTSPNGWRRENGKI